MLIICTTFSYLYDELNQKEKTKPEYIKLLENMENSGDLQIYYDDTTSDKTQINNFVRYY